MLNEQITQPAPIAGFCTVAQAAEQLGLRDDLGVLRLIGRGRLRAARLGGDGPWRVGLPGLQAYIAAGAPDLKGPPISGRWFDPLDTSFASGLFKAGILAAVDGELPETAPDDGAEIVLPITPRLRAVGRQPIKRLGPGFERPVDFLDKAHAYLVELTRAAAWKILRGGSYNRSAPLRRLYENLDEVSQLALQEVGKQAISFTAKLPAAGGEGAPVTVTGRVGLADFLNERRDAVLLAAF